ncbi:hypothetical protein [Haladaptatus sp. DFWS20]
MVFHHISGVTVPENGRSNWDWPGALGASGLQRPGGNGRTKSERLEEA